MIFFAHWNSSLTIKSRFWQESNGGHSIRSRSIIQSSWAPNIFLGIFNAYFAEFSTYISIKTPLLACSTMLPFTAGVISHCKLQWVYHIRNRRVSRNPTLNSPIFFTHGRARGSQWPRGLRRWSTAVCLLRSWIPIPPEAWMFVCWECCVLPGRGLCEELTTRPEESYRLWCVVVCDIETSSMRSQTSVTCDWTYEIFSLEGTSSR